LAEKFSWDWQTDGIGLVWRNRKKISQIINDYLCLPFFLLIILWKKHTAIDVFCVRKLVKWWMCIVNECCIVETM
jgi:hypothetical protein